MWAPRDRQMMKVTILGLAGLAAAVLGVAPSSYGAQADAAPSAAQTFATAVKLLEARRHADAIRLLRQVLATYPDDPAVLWNLGIASAKVGEHRNALSAWLALRRVNPTDWRIGPKLIQAYQALGDHPSRDAEQQALYQRRRAAPRGSDLALLTEYCREQTTIAGHEVSGYETFVPAGARRVFYKFLILDDAGYERFRFSLGSYDSTTEFARERGELAPDERLYHLDRYEGWTHATYGFLTRPPSYDETRKLVVQALSGLLQPISSFRPDGGRPAR